MKKFLIIITLISNSVLAQTYHSDQVFMLLNDGSPTEAKIKKCFERPLIRNSTFEITEDSIFITQTDPQTLETISGRYQIIDTVMIEGSKVYKIEGSMVEVVNFAGNKYITRIDCITTRFYQIVDDKTL